MASQKGGNDDQRGGSGSFANDPQRASEAGKKGGEHSHQQDQSSQRSGTSQQGGSQPGGHSEQQGGQSGSFKNDPEKAREAGRKGGESHNK